MKLSKIFLFAIFLIFLANYFWAQSCSEGEKRCNPNDPYQVQMCQNGVWMPILSCNPDTMICQNGDCVQKQSSLPDSCLTDGAKRCNPNDPYQVQICQNGVWTPFLSCNPDTMICQNGYCIYIDNNPPEFCPPEMEGKTKCNPNDPYEVQICQNGVWMPILSCNPDTMICQNGDCVQKQSSAECNDNEIRCDPNDPTLTKRQVCLGGKWIEAQPSCDGEISVCSSGICVDSRCNESVIMCSSKFSDAYLICENGTWSRKFCPSGMICQNGNCVQKQSSPPQQPPSSQPTSSSGGGGGTGGGPVSAKPCSKWSDWFVNSSIEIVDPATPSISCLNITYLRWCVRADGSLDNSRFEKKTEINCGQKSSANTEEVCNYQLVLKQDYLDYSDGKCRTCANETYVYTCYPSNKKDFSKQRNSISCGPARECTPEELNKLGKAALNPPSQDNYSLFGSLAWFVNQVGPAVLLLIGLLVLGVAGFLFWKFYSSAKKEQSEE